MYLIVVEADDGSWLSEAEGADDRSEAVVIAHQLARRYRRPASIYSCDFVREIEPETVNS